MSDLNSTTETAVTHTPGPWRYVDGVIVAEQFDHVVMVKREDGSEHPHHDGLTALVYGRHIDGHYTHDANAHLIAAAPDMLKALKETLEFWKATRFAECENGCDCVVDVVRAAIAKATAVPS